MMNQQMNTAETKQTVKETRYAGFWIRFAAHLIDWLVLSFIQGILIIPFLIIIGISVAMGVEDFAYCEWDNWDSIEALGYAAGIISIIVIASLVELLSGWLYYALMQSSKSQATLGKLAVGIKVTDMDGDRITFLRATGRYFSKIISGMILYVGYIMAGFTDRKQALHDFIASTYVVYKD